MNKSVVISVDDMGVGFDAASDRESDQASDHKAAATGRGLAMVILPLSATAPGTEAS
jgi:hypothetical protein